VNMSHAHKFAVIQALAVLLIGACASSSISEAPSATAKFSRLESTPAEVISLGAMGVQFEVTATGGKEQLAKLPLSEEDRMWLEDSSLRLAQWDSTGNRYEVLPQSHFDPLSGNLKATVNQDGRYAVFGISRVPAIGDFQRRICDVRRSRTATVGFSGNAQIRIPDICPVILCPAFDARAWGRAFAGPDGQPVEELLIVENFGNACDICLNPGFGPGDFPECWIPEEPVQPPALEQMPIDIRHGGRAVAIAVDPEDDDTIVVASETGGLFRTTDGANHWRHQSGSLTFDFTDVAFSTTDPSRVVASAKRDTWVTSRGGLYFSDDKGATWTQVSANPPTPACLENWAASGVDYEATDDRFWAATNCGIAFSDDNGENWDYLPSAPGYSQTDTRAVIAPEPGHLKILRGNRVRVTEDGGASWATSTTGLPSTVISSGVHNQIALSPFNHEHIFWAFNYRIPDPASPGDFIWNWALYLSTDNGATWSMVLDTPGINRPPMVRTAMALSGGSGYDIYYANGGGLFQRATVPNPATPVAGTWTVLNVDHADHSDVAFSNDGRTPLLLTSDGGVHWTEDDGLNWAYTPDMGRGYNALQITEVTGQLAPRFGAADLYFGTQDNSIWGSPDEGATWPHNTSGEGFFLNVWRDALPASETKVTGVGCWRCGNFIADPVLVGASGFPNPPNDNGNPRLLEPGAYVQRIKIAGVADTLFSLTTDNGGMWTTRYGFSETLKALPDVSYLGGDPVVFSAIQLPGATPEGTANLGIKRIDGVLGTGTPVVSDVPGFSGLGTFPTMFAWYKPYGVAPDDPNLIIAPDIVNDQVMKTTDGGSTPWVADTDLTDLVTATGDIRFHWNRGNTAIGQVSTIGFDPDCEGHILVGTRQAGILRTFDGGMNWHRVDRTMNIPRVSRFFFTGDGKVIVSSYGRGLWRMRYTCPGVALPPLLDWIRVYERPVLVFEGRVIRLDALNTNSCKGCRLLRAEAGSIAGFEADMQAQEHSTVVKHLLEAGNVVRGGLVEDKQLRGLVLASKDVSPKTIALPEPQAVAPQLTVGDSSLVGLPIAETGSIVVSGRGFDANRPLRIFLDGEQLKSDYKLVFDKEGKFELRIPPPSGLGEHSILVEQDSDEGVLRALATFHLTVQDSESGEVEDKM